MRMKTGECEEEGRMIMTDRHVEEVVERSSEWSSSEEADKEVAEILPHIGLITMSKEK